MVQKGWNASAYLPALLKARGMTQQELADATSIDRGTINGYCTGRLDLGPKNATRIAGVLDVSVLEVGAPAEAAPELAGLILDRLAALEAAMNELAAEVRQDLVALTRRVRALEQQAPPGTLQGGRSR